MNKTLCAGLLLLTLLPSTARALQAEILVDKGDNPLTIQGWVGEENSFVGNIGLTLKDAAQNSVAVKLNVYKSDLQQAGGPEKIGRQHVVVTGDQTLTPGVPTTYQVQVTGVRVPGEYGGTIELLLPGQPRESAVIVKVLVVASVRPALTLLTEADRLQANVVNCGFDCGLARLLLPMSNLQDKLELRFEKPLSAPLVIRDWTYAVRGDQTRYSLTGKQLNVSPEGLTGMPSEKPKEQGAAGAQSAAAANAPLLADKKYLNLPVVISAANIPADHYVGNLYLTVEGQSSALKVPVDLNVRSGPFWPLLMLLISILLGRLFKYMQDKGKAKADALESIYRLDFRAREAHPDDAEIISQMLRESRDLVYQDRTAEVSAAVSLISARLVMLSELRQIEARLAGKEQEPAAAKILSDIRQAREHIRLKQDTQVKALVNNIKEALVTLAAAPTLTDSETDNLADAVARAGVAAGAAAGVGTTGSTVWRRTRGFLASLSGVSDEFRAEATLWLARPLLWLVLLLGLVALGIKTIYIDNPVFGANPFTDFLGLMFWGLSADVASRTLSSLRVNNASRAVGG